MPTMAVFCILNFVLSRHVAQVFYKWFLVGTSSPIIIIIIIIIITIIYGHLCWWDTRNFKLYIIKGHISFKQIYGIIITV